MDKNRAKFAHIKDVELQSRKKFCEDVQVVVDGPVTLLCFHVCICRANLYQFANSEIKYGMTDDPAIRRKLDDDEQKKRRDVYGSSAAALGGGGVDAEREREKENDTFLRGQARQQKEMIRDQDVQLDHLGRAVDRLGQIGRDVNQELKEQNIMLDGLDKDMNDASDRMDTVMGQMQKLLNSKDGCQIWTIVILALILVILSESTCFNPICSRNILILKNNIMLTIFLSLFRSCVGDLVTINTWVPNVLMKR